MSYVISIAVLIVVLFFLHYSNGQKRKRKIERLRLDWGNSKEDFFDFDRIRNFSDAVKENKFHNLTEQTIEDIDFYRLFKFIDRTTSKVGQQFLFKKVI